DAEQRPETVPVGSCSRRRPGLGRRYSTRRPSAARARRRRVSAIRWRRSSLLTPSCSSSTSITGSSSRSSSFGSFHGLRISASCSCGRSVHYRHEPRQSEVRNWAISWPVSGSDQGWSGLGLLYRTACPSELIAKSHARVVDAGIGAGQVGVRDMLVVERGAEMLVEAIAELGGEVEIGGRAHDLTIRMEAAARGVVEGGAGLERARQAVIGIDDPAGVGQFPIRTEIAEARPSIGAYRSADGRAGRQDEIEPGGPLGVGEGQIDEQDLRIDGNAVLLG